MVLNLRYESSKQVNTHTVPRMSRDPIGSNNIFSPVLDKGIYLILNFVLKCVWNIIRTVLQHCVRNLVRNLARNLVRYLVRNQFRTVVSAVASGRPCR